MAREGWRSEGGLLSDNCDNGLIGQWGPGDTGGGGQHQQHKERGNLGINTLTPPRQLAVQHGEYYSMSTVSSV